MQNPTSLNYREDVEQYYRKHIVDFFFLFSYHENFKAHDSYKHISY